jgi:multiple sugar transport system permease protein
VSTAFATKLSSMGKKARRGSRPGPEALLKHGLIAPPLLFYILLSIFPLLLSIYFSLTSMDAAGIGGWVGVENYRRLFSDPIFLRGYENTLLYAFLGVPIQYVLGLGLALLVHGLSRGKRIIRLAFLVPFMVAPLIAGFVWSTLLDTRFGPINQLLSALGGPSVPWLTEPTVAFVSVLIVDTWQWTPFMFLIMYAGLRTLPIEPFEAARVDGASNWRIFWDVTFPMLLPATIAAVLLRFIEAAKLFDVVYYMTAGGPGNSTSTVSLLAFFAGTQSGNYGYAAAMTIALLVTVIVVGMGLPIVVSLLARMRRDNAQTLAIQLVRNARQSGQRVGEPSAS